MPGPIDDTLKHLTELSPQDWVVQGCWTAAPATLIDADIVTITGATDKVAKRPDQLLYNSALFKRHCLRVRLSSWSATARFCDPSRR
jgi:hypothetical protein